jgi:hypothetical protein
MKRNQCQFSGWFLHNTKLQVMFKQCINKIDQLFILGKNKDWLPNDQLTTEMHLTVLTIFLALSKVSLLNQLQ